MRVPLEWLHEYCRPELDTEALAERLTMTGTKVESIHNYGVGAPEKFVVGRVLGAEQHPRRVLRARHQHPQIHQLDVGEQRRQIRCTQAGR